VKEATEVKLRLGDLQQNFSVYQFGQERWRVENDVRSFIFKKSLTLRSRHVLLHTFQTDASAGVRPLLKSKKVYRRVLRMKKDHPSTSAQILDASESKEQGKSVTDAKRLDFQEEEEDDGLVICRDGDFTSMNRDSASSPQDSKQPLSPTASVSWWTILMS
jgi:hypothetical protein